MYAQTYQDADQHLTQTAEQLQGHGLFALPWEYISPLIGDPRIYMVFWDKEGNLLGLAPEVPFFRKHQALLTPQTLNKIEEIKLEDLYFRTITVELNTNLGSLDVQLLRNVNAERAFLNTLLIIMLIGYGLAVICAMVIGYYLAGRALIPIQQSWKKQQQFVSDASHELRTPLAVIQAKTDLLFRSPSATIEEKSEDISVIAKECRRLSKLVANLLTLARSDANQLEIIKQPFRLDELVKEIVDHYAEMAAYQGKKMELYTDSPIFFVADKERIYQLLVILLDNAMKYTDEGGWIHLSCRQTASSITIAVQDNGIGIAKEDLPKIFDRFFQSDKARNKSDGTGLGLSIAKWIVERHGGKIKVDSQQGQGTRFEVTFPKQLGDGRQI
jgi:signal transduction histidine kinase